MQKSLRDQLRTTRGALLTSSKASTPTHPSQWVKDGEDHVNVYSSGETQLGRFLNPRYTSNINHPLLGNFRSLENLMMFVRMSTFDDRVRMQDNFVRMREIINAAGGLQKSTVNYRAIAIHSAWVRVLRNEQLMHLIIESDLPFDSYTVDPATGLRQRFDPTLFMLDGYSEIRQALKERRSPNLKRWIDKGELYEDLMIRLTGAYNANMKDILDKFEQGRWEAYDAWLERGKKREERAAEVKAQKEQAGFEKKAGKKKSVIVEIGGVSKSVISSETEPEKPRVGARWFNPVLNETKILIQLTDSVIWVTIEELQSKVFYNSFNKTIVTAMDLSTADYLMLDDKPLHVAAWEDGWKVFNPITRSFLFPVKETAESDVTWTKDRPERFKRAERDQRKVPAAEELVELAAVPAATVQAVDEELPYVAGAEVLTGEEVQAVVDSMTLSDVPETPAIVEVEEPALDESFSLAAASAEVEEAPAIEPVVVVQDANSALGQLDDEPVIAAV